MSKIEKDKPLPSRTKLRYEECYAKVFLEYFYPDKYQSLILQDKPDLYDGKNSVGIEVVEAVECTTKKAKSLWNSIPYVSDVQKNKNIKKMRKLGIEYMEGVQLWPRRGYNNDIDSYPFKVLYEEIIKKLERLKSGEYRECTQYELFVSSELMMEDNWNDKMLQRLANISAEYNKKYRLIHIVTQDKLCSYDIDNDKFEIKAIQSEVQFNLAIKAREFVENGEK